MTFSSKTLGSCLNVRWYFLRDHIQNGALISRFWSPCCRESLYIISDSWDYAIDRNVYLPSAVMANRSLTTRCTVTASICPAFNSETWVLIFLCMVQVGRGVGYSWPDRVQCRHSNALANKNLALVNGNFFEVDNNTQLCSDV
jgi:hypothetical protein